MIRTTDPYETQFMEEKWQKDFKILEKKADDFRDYFDKNRKCRCNIYSCKHFKKANSELFDEKFHELVNRKMHIGLRTMKECAPELFVYKPKNRRQICSKLQETRTCVTCRAKFSVKKTSIRNTCNIICYQKHTNNVKKEHIALSVM